MTRKTTFFEGWSWFKLNTLGLARGMTLKFYASMEKGLKLKVRNFCGLSPSFVEVTGEKLVRGGMFAPPPSILNRVKALPKHKQARLLQTVNNEYQQSKQANIQTDKH